MRTIFAACSERISWEPRGHASARHQSSSLPWFRGGLLSPLLLAFLLAPPLSAQESIVMPYPRELAGTDVLTESGIVEDLRIPVRSFVPRQAHPLPVLDDSGRLITHQEISQRIDDSGTAGMLLGGVAGLVVGGLVGAGLSKAIDCGRASGIFGPYDNCSPQEDALRSAIGGGITIIGTVALGWAGWRADQTPWWEAVREIREERRESEGTSATIGNGGSGQ